MIVSYLIIPICYYNKKHKLGKKLILPNRNFCGSSCGGRSMGHVRVGTVELGAIMPPPAGTQSSSSRTNEAYHCRISLIPNTRLLTPNSENHALGKILIPNPEMQVASLRSKVECSQVNITQATQIERDSSLLEEFNSDCYNIATRWAQPEDDL